MSGNTSEIGNIGGSPRKSSLFFLTIMLTLESDCPARRLTNWESNLFFGLSGALPTILENPVA